MKRLLILLFSFLLSTIICAQQRKVALIIGNETYAGHFSKLHTPKNDAEAMFNVLRKLGFEAIIAKDLKRDSMSYYVDEFAKLANGADISLFYYSGHAGIGKNDEYFLAPSGDYGSAETLTQDCYSFQAIENRIKKISAPTKIYIIDACRNSIDGSKDMVRYTPQSLTKNFSNAKGTVYCFATGVNKTAQTGIGEYSIFTESLLNHIGDTGNLFYVWGKISDEVTRANPEQTPFLQETTNGLSRNIYLNPNNVHIYDDIKHGLDIYTIVTTPSDAVISIEGKEYKSGQNIRLRYGEKKVIAITAKGYIAYKGTITPTPYKTLYNFSLDKLAEARLNLNCDKAGAIAYFDDEYIGSIPVIIDTYAGMHNIRIECAGYDTYYARPVLTEGTQFYDARLIKHKPWFWDWDDDGLNILSYHYGYKYPIGISYMYRPESFRFSFGAIAGVSTGLFRGWDLGPSITTTILQSTSISLGTDNNTKGYNEELSTIDGSEEPYSDFIDPYNEAKHYDASALLLANVGYNPCNGIILELGVGAGYHRDLYYMDHTYLIKKTIKTDTNTGEVIVSPYVYEQQSKSNWYKENGKWSPAMRLGIKFNIPVGSENYITLGGGYTHLFSNKKHSSWDASLGFAWEF